MDQQLVVEIYYQTPGNKEVTIFLKKETGFSQTPDMNADITTENSTVIIRLLDLEVLL